jgi:hypothetical protein
MTPDDRDWLHRVADALDKAERTTTRDRNLDELVVITISHELAIGVSDRLRAIADSRDPDQHHLTPLP